MSASHDCAYPGELATIGQLLELAEEYRRAAHMLQPLGRKGIPLSRAPFRLCAIQAIELHLSAYLIERGHAIPKVRGLQHDLSARADMAIAAGLKFRKRTTLHLRKLANDREYLVTRYGPELAGTTSQINRLLATLEEVAIKVQASFAQKAPEQAKRAA